MQKMQKRTSQFWRKKTETEEQTGSQMVKNIDRQTEE